MIRLLFAVLLVLFASPGQAETKNVTISYDIDAAWSHNTKASWINADIRGVTKPRRMAVAITNHQTEILRVWDTPANRQFTISFDYLLPLGNRLQLQPIAYEGQPWQAATAYAVGDMLATGTPLVVDSVEIAGGFPSTSSWMECTRAGTSGSTEPTWPAQTPLTSGYIPLADSMRVGLTGAVVDNGDGTVKITASYPTEGHTFVAGDSVTFTGHASYNGAYTLPAQTGGDATHIILTHAYVAATFGATQTLYLTSGAAADLGGGLVSIPCPAHGFVEGQSVSLQFTANYSAAAHTLPSQTLGDADHVVITATYVAESFGPEQSAYLTGGTIVNHSGTVTIPAQAHGFVAGDIIDITGLTNYTANPYTLPTQTNGDADHLEITAAFTAEVIFLASAVKRINDPDGAGPQWKYTTARPLKPLSAAAAANLGGGLVSIPCPAHGFVAGDSVAIVGTTNYNAYNYTLPTQTGGDANHFAITAPYVAETFTTADNAVIYPPSQQTLLGETTGRIIVKDSDNNDQVERGGTNFIRRYTTP